MQLKNKTAIVTGAASGIGKEIARQFVRQGAKVAIADLNIDATRGALVLGRPAHSSVRLRQPLRDCYQFLRRFRFRRFVDRSTSRRLAGS
jgi:NAD(P)-dependent dehydrogenase (short-subunit alcohol dehydrogenase family)